MAEIGNNNTDYIGYEYKEVEVKKELASLYMDSYPCFGWEIDPNRTAESEKMYGYVALHFRRNRKICNKMELTRLQRNFDGVLSEIGHLERSKTTKAAAVALLVGILGTVFMAGSVFAVTAEPPIIFLCVILAIPGFVLWILPYFLYRRLVRRRTEQVAPLVEDKLDEIYTICENGKQLLF